jgi:hypothetical protein
VVARRHEHSCHLESALNTAAGTVPQLQTGSDRQRPSRDSEECLGIRSIPRRYPHRVPGNGRVGGGEALCRKCGWQQHSAASPRLRELL